MKIEYLEKDKSGLDLVAPLWEKLKEHHRVRSTHFKEQFVKMSWTMRRKEILDKAHNGAILVHLAKDSNMNNLVGYCVTSIDDKNVGEIETIFIEAEYRRAGIGATFMKRALKWMDSKSVTRKVIAVAAGNEEAFGFYAKYNFYPRASILMQTEVKK
jgi:ribosomal protein S18 acetylase RimI-like enzyme